MTYVAKDEAKAVTQTDILRELVKVIDGGLKCVSLETLDQTFEAPRNRIATRVSLLTGQGYVRSYTMGCYVPTAAGRKLIANGGEVKPGPRQGIQHKPRETDTHTLRARLWRAMILLQRATVSELVQRAATAEDANPIEACRRYISHLCRAEYLVKLPRRKKGTSPTSNGEVVYWLKQSNGRLPPRVRKKRGEAGMYDPNNDSWRPFVSTQATPKAQKRGVAA